MVQYQKKRLKAKGATMIKGKIRSGISFLLSAIMIITLSNFFAISDVNAYSRPSKYYQITDKRIVFSKSYKLSEYKEGRNNHSMGMRVVKVKKELRKRGYLYISNNNQYIGKFDSSTKYAVKSFQRKHKIKATGKVDYKTWKKLGFTKSSRSYVYTPKLLTNAESSKKDHIKAMIKTAASHIGKTQYAWGCSGKPGTYTDCSGLALQCLYSAGINPKSVNVVSHTKSKYRFGSRILGSDSKLGKTVSKPKKGDLVFYVLNGYAKKDRNICHVALYVGGGKIIDNWPGIGVKKRSKHISGEKIYKYKRIFW